MTSEPLKLGESTIDWNFEIEKAEQMTRKECCIKFIDLARQIADERNAYKSMWGAEFELRRSLSTRLYSSAPEDKQ